MLVVVAVLVDEVVSEVVDVEDVVVVTQRSGEFFTVNTIQYGSDCKRSLIAT